MRLNTRWYTKKKKRLCTIQDFKKSPDCKTSKVDHYYESPCVKKTQTETRKPARTPGIPPKEPNTTRWRGDIVWTLSDTWWNRQQTPRGQKSRLSRVAEAQSRLRMRICFILHIKWSCKSGETIEDIPAKPATNWQNSNQSRLTKNSKSLQLKPCRAPILFFTRNYALKSE